MTGKPTDCVLFISEEMARLLIAWQRVGLDPDGVKVENAQFAYSPIRLSVALGISAGQVAGLVKQAILVGAIEQDGQVSVTAQKVVNNIVAARVKSLAG